MDEPEAVGALTLAAREQLDNLIFVVNCNLQRLDGPVRGNGKIIQELEAVFRGAGWNVIKVVWGDNWDALLGCLDCVRLRAGSSSSTTTSVSVSPWLPCSPVVTLTPRLPPTGRKRWNGLRPSTQTSSLRTWSCRAWMALNCSGT